MVTLGCGIFMSSVLIEHALSYGTMEQVLEVRGRAMPSKKQRAAEAPQPPSFTTPLPSAPALVEQILDRASYGGQRWHDLRLDGQEADDCSFEQLHIRGGSLRETRLTLAQFADCRIETVDLAGAVW